jgi:hypothetical protein
MKIVVIGGNGRIGSKLIENLVEHGHDALAADLDTGGNTLTGEGLARGARRRGRGRRRVQLTVLRGLGGTGVLPDVDRHHPGRREGSRRGESRCAVGGRQRSPSRQRLVLDRPRDAVLRVHRGDRRGRHRGSRSPRSTAPVRPWLAGDGDTVRLPAALIQPAAADDVARAVGRTAVGTPVNGVVEVAGPEPFRFDELIRRGLSARSDPRHVVADPDARYFGTTLTDTSLLPAENAELGETRFEDWLGVLATRS